MNVRSIPYRGIAVIAALLLSALLTACGGSGGKDPIFGGVAVTNAGPRVTSVSPAPNASAVPTNIRQITVTFNQAMDASTLNAASFQLACPSTTPVTGVVSYIPSINTAVLTLPGVPLLPVSTLCVATITTAAKSATGQALPLSFAWQWTTAATPDTTPPTVISTIHANGAINVATNTKIGTTFSEAMNALSVNGTNFQVKQTSSGAPVAGNLVYSSNNAVFTPAASLLPSTQYTITVKGGAGGVSDISGNVMASDYVWSWTTACAQDTTPPVVVSSSPLDVALGVCMNKTVNATFNEAMDPLTITNNSFTLSVTSGAAVSGLVSYDALTRIASFNPTGNLVGTPASSNHPPAKPGAFKL